MGHSRRVFYIITSPDFVQWSNPELVSAPDLRDDASSLARLQEVRHSLDVPDDPAIMRTQFYEFPVYSHVSCLVTFPWIFTINNNARYGNQDGAMEVQIAVSRDLRYFDRQFRLPVIPVGPPGPWEDSHGDELRHRVKWIQDPAIGATRGKPVKLVFHMKSASLFSFAFRQ